MTRAFSGFVALDKLPTSLIAALRRADGTVYSFCDRHLIDISESPDALQLYKEFLTNAKSGVDPLVSPYFGRAQAPCVTVAAQDDVWSLLETYSRLLAPDFIIGARVLPFFEARHPLPLCAVHFRHAKIALQAVQDEIESLAFFAAECPALAAVPSGATICDLAIQYGNCNIGKRLRRK